MLSLTGAKQTSMNKGERERERTTAAIIVLGYGHSQVRKIINLAVIVNLFG